MVGKNIVGHSKPKSQVGILKIQDLLQVSICIEYFQCGSSEIHRKEEC